MLHLNLNLVSPETLILTKELQSITELNKFYLVGGTALALQMGHRNSIDIDLFSQDDFDSMEILKILKEKYNVIERYKGKNTIILFINNIKVDFITHPYPFVNQPIIDEGIRFLSKEDITAMKLNAIAQSGKRLKDFIDIYFLLQHYSLSSMIEFYKVKYPHSNPLIPLKAINYFDDIDLTQDAPKMLFPLSFHKIKSRIQEATLHPFITF